MERGNSGGLAPAALEMHGDTMPPDVFNRSRVRDPMDREDARQIAKALFDELEKLEAQATLTDQIKRAYEGRFIPLGALGDKCSPAEYFADEYDFKRGRIRNAYFGVGDVGQRQRLIRARLQLEQAEERMGAERFRSREKDVRAAKSKSLPWITAGLVGASCVIVGYEVKETAGAIAGALLGFFVGQGTIHNAKESKAQAIADAEEELKTEANEQRTKGKYPPSFTAQEQNTGERDKDFDRESAYVAVLQASSVTTLS